MNESEPRIVDSPDLAELKRECADLRRQSTTLLIGLVVMSFTLAAFIGLQARRAGKDLEAVRLQGLQVQQFNEKQLPAILNRLAQYAQAHPDFQPVLTKYGINVVTNSNATVKATSPARAK